jgi:hypothetical protein
MLVSHSKVIMFFALHLWPEIAAALSSSHGMLCRAWLMMEAAGAGLANEWR